MDTTAKDAIAASEVESPRAQLAAEKACLAETTENDRWRFDVDKEPLPPPIPGRAVRLWDGIAERILSIPVAWQYYRSGHLKAWRPASNGPTAMPGGVNADAGKVSP